MSRVYFHSPTRTAELRGSERAWLGGLVRDIAVGVLDLNDSARVDRLRPLIHPGHYMANLPTTGIGWLTRWASSYTTAFAVGWDHGTPLIQYQGQTIDPFSLALNTAAVLGSDQVKLAARLHGQCELHAWVDGPNRSWLADIMQAGLDNGTYRRGIQYAAEPDHGHPEPEWVSQGWEDVIALLRERDDEPVVTSFSVCDGFPNSSIGDWMPPWPEGRARSWDALTDEQKQARSERSDAWHDLEPAEQWRIAMDGLRASSDGLEIKPDNWHTFRFTHNLTVLDLLANDWEDRVQRTLAKANEPEEAAE
ncbi:hypothetical protein OIE49_29555 [Streptomyces sp. NBC_01788]|uniref:hypothetical protein n=1 Tax=Streptomyces sp. NBC_01788 TaxID=2975940 RepID=UPI002DDB4158|nr:hypothetical protein [Streptomyces sp. NBC_01788]WSB29700.1 hypothetical protein OIE49_29555 [Streptomyces sp. NBC_01788]